MAGTTPATVEINHENGRTFTPTLSADGRIVIPPPQPRGTQKYDAAALDELANISYKEGQVREPALEKADEFSQKAIALTGLDAKAAENTQPLNPSTPGFKPIMKP